MNNLVVLPVVLEDGPVFLHLPARMLTRKEAKRLTNIIYAWGPDAYGKLQTVYRDDKGRFSKEIL